MRIGGLQKMTLLDYPGKVACTVFLSGCNLRCPFCHNASLVLPERLTPAMEQAELLAFLKKRKGLLDGVCITGGEPTLHKDLPQLIEQVKDLGYAVKLDTNGSDPDMLKKVLPMVDHVAMDVKNAPEKYEATCGGIDILDKVQESVSILMNGTVDYEFRTTVYHPAHTPADMDKLGQWLRGAKRYYIQKFTDSGDLVGSGAALTDAEMEELLLAVRKWIPQAALRGV